MSNEDFLREISFDGEVWKDIIGYEGLYQVSNFGRVVSLGRIIERTNQSPSYIKPRLIAPRLSKSGYLQIGLWKNNKGLNKYIHRLVALLFLPNPENYPCVDHCDTCKTNNHVGNLKWVSYSMNNLNPITRKRNSDAKEKDSRIVQRTQKPIVRINPKDSTDVKFYESIASAERLDGFSAKCIGNAVRGIVSKSQGFNWMFLSDYEASCQ